MKGFLFAAVLLAVTPFAIAQSGGMKGMDMKDMPMKDMDMKMDKKGSKGMTHQATGVITRVDSTKSKVTIKHEPVRSINWGPMTMAFTVKDKAMLEKLNKDQKVDFEFVQEGKDYVVTKIK
jgi:Cu(I)/Ag(I) efflux system periplasmic protein CusF